MLFKSVDKEVGSVPFHGASDNLMFAMVTHLKNNYLASTYIVLFMLVCCST